MSGKPSKEGVEKFTALLKDLSDATQHVIRLGKVIEESKEEYKSWEIIRTSARIDLFKLMEEMDIMANHNTGWDGRITSFYIELYRQTKS